MISSLFIFYIFSFSVVAAEATPQTIASPVGEAMGVYFENDSRNIGGPGSDQAYSNGFKFSYIYAEDRIPIWAKTPFPNFNLLDKNIQNSKVNFGISLGHQIYTPNNTQVQSLQVNDRPYAGWLYLGFSVSLKSGKVGQFLELDIGTIGKSALGKEVQNNFHDLIHEPHAEGWANSLHDELTLQLFYQQRSKLVQAQNFDFISYYGGGFGNVQIAAHVGGLIRAGYHLPDDFGPGRPSASNGDSFVSPLKNPGKKTSYYLFAGATGNAIARNIFLDGNTFQSSHRVKKYPFIFETEFGLGAQLMPYSLVWRFVTRSPEFEERSRFNSFASLNLIYLFN